MTSPTKKRVFGVIRPESGIDWQFFGSTAKKEGLTLAPGGEVVYSVPIDTSQTTAKNQEEAPVLVAKLKDAGVTTVMLFTSFGMNQQVLKAADSLDYHPEWFFTGMGAQDIEITARILQGLAPEQMKHVFGLGDLPLYVSGIDDPQVNWFNWYWGKNQGVYSAGTVGTLYLINAGVSLAGPKLTPKTFQQGLFSMPTVRRRREQPGAELHVRNGTVTQPSVRRVLPGGTRLRHHVVEPHRGRARARSSSTTAPAGSCTSTTPSATPPVSGRRASRSCSTRATRSRSSTDYPRLTPCPTTPAPGVRRPRVDAQQLEAHGREVAEAASLLGSRSR